MLWADSVAAEKGMTEEPYRSEEVLVEGLKAGGYHASRAIALPSLSTIPAGVTLRSMLRSIWTQHHWIAALGHTSPTARRSPASPSRESRRLSPKDYAR